jgi:LPXTG-site transpeptidase (sortase) family protein
MYTRRSTNGSIARWLIGIVIIVGAIIAFVMYESAHEAALLPAPSQAVALNPTITPNPGPTKSAIEYRIVSDKAALSAVIIELYFASDADTWDLSHLGQSAGHLEGTPQMGQGGNFVLAGHVELKDGSSGPFADLKRLTAGDRITIIGNTQPKPIVRQYVVSEVGKVAPMDFDVMRNHGYEELTLITCDDWDQKSQTYNSRVIVHARLANGLSTSSLTPSPTTKK